MLRKKLDDFLDRLPNWAFALTINTYSKLFSKGFKIVSSDGDWLILRNGGIRLLSPTPKCLGLSLKVFQEKFEYYFKVEQGDTVIDVGACIGDTTAPFALKTGNRGLVVAVEPEPLNIKYLKINTCAFGNVKVVEKAAWNKREPMTFNVYSRPTGHSLTPIGVGYVSTIKVQADTLDNISKSCGRAVDYLKIDAQGSELQVLEGARKLLKKVKKVVVETHT